MTGSLALAQPPEQTGPPPASVRVGETQIQSLQNRWDVIGRLRQVRQSVVTSEISGKIVEVPVAEGDAVNGATTVLARVDDVWARTAAQRAQADLAAANAEQAEAEARLVKSKSDMEKLSDLLATGAAQPREYAEAQAVHDADRARIEAAIAHIRAAEADLERAKYELDRVEIKAPFDGVIVRKLIEVGEWAQPGAAVVDIVSRGTIDAVINVPERLINNIQVGSTMPVHVDALDAELDGQVAAVIPQGDNPSRTFPVKIRLNDQDGQLKSGMSVTARVPTTEMIEALTVPRDAVLQTPTGAVVWADVGGKAVSVPVQVLFGHGDRYAIKPLTGETSPLADKMPVVIEGAERIFFPGQPLTVVE